MGGHRACIAALRPYIQAFRVSWVLLVAIWLLGAHPALIATAAPAENDTRRALVILASGADLRVANDDVVTAGGQVIHVFPPDAFIADIPADSPPLVGISAFYFGRVSESEISALSPTAQSAARLWNNLLGQNLSSQTVPDLHPELQPDAFEAPPPPAAALQTAADEPLPGYYETSEYFIGKVAVGIVLPESNGAGDPSTEDWTVDERALVVSQIVQALDWWAEREGRARLSFVYENAAGATVPTGVEPIARSYYHQQYWIADAMSALGFAGGSYFDQVRQYNNALRQRHQTDWAFTIFVVDSSSDPDNRFSDGYFAYAYLGGPFMVMTYGNNGYGPGYMNAVAAHEVGHVFMALDQYASASQGCTRRAGYLQVENQNSDLGCASNEPSIMRGQVWPYAGRAVDNYARGQLGWRDSDADGILDPVDVEVQLRDVTHTAPNPQMPNVLSFSGQVEESPFPSPTRRDVLINRITRVEYRVDGGAWYPAQAQDGQFDSYREGFAFTTDPLPSGSHTLELQVVDNFQNVLAQPVAQVDVVDPIDGLVDTAFNSLGPDADQAESDVRQFAGLASAVGMAIVEVQYRLDGGPWLAAQPLDGTFGHETERFLVEIDTAALGLGSHVLQARAVVGGGFIESSPALASFTVPGSVFSVYLPLIHSR